VIGLEADQDVGVANADGAGVVIGHVDAADREPDVADDAVELIGGNDTVNGGPDPVGQTGRLLDPCSRGGADMQLDLAAIHGREEVLAEIGRKAERQNAENQESGDHLDPVAQTELQQALIGFADVFEHVLKPRWKRASGLRLALA